MSFLNNLFGKNKNELNIRQILEFNVDKIADEIDSEFNTRVLECGIAESGEQNYILAMPENFIPPTDGNYLGYLFIPIDANGYILTNNSYEMLHNKLDRNSVIDSYKLQQFSSEINEPQDVCDFIRSKFGGGSIYSGGGLPINSNEPASNKVQNIEKFGSIHYLCFFYFVNNKFVTI